MRRRRVVLVGSLVMALLATIVIPAQAAMTTPPRAVLYTGLGHLRGSMWSAQWSYRSGGGCVTLVSDGIPTYSKKVRFSSTHWTHIRLERRRMPRAVRLTAYTHLDQDGYPSGPGQTWETTLKPHVKDGNTAWWTVRFTPGLARRYFLNLRVGWGSPTPCGRQTAEYSFKMVRG